MKISTVGVTLLISATPFFAYAGGWNTPFTLPQSPAGTSVPVPTGSDSDASKNFSTDTRSASNALSDLWSTTETVRFNYPGGRLTRYDGAPSVSPKAGIGWSWMENPNISITYRARAINETTGDLIPCDSSVPVGTQVRFDFDEHAYQDVYWFATGGGSDSPYGEWNNNAEPPPIQCNDKDKATDDKNPRYIVLSVSPPQKRIDGLDSATCETSGDDRVCTLADEGTLGSRFVFGNTMGHFYFRIDARNAGRYCEGSQTAMKITKGKTAENTGEKNAYILRVPERSISCNINFTTLEGVAPSTPRLTAGACDAGGSQELRMRADDPEGDDIQYAIDWFGDGSVDEYYPTEGGDSFVPSGTEGTATIVHIEDGNTIIAKVRAKDRNLNVTGWASISMTCPARIPDTQCSDTYDNDGDGLVDILDPDCSDGSGGSEFSSAPTTGPSSTPPPAPAQPDLYIRAKDSSVQRGGTTSISWGAVGVLSCEPVTGDNADSFAQVSGGTNSFQSPVDGRITSPIEKQTIYTLRCIDLYGTVRTKRAFVSLIPKWKEH